MHKVTPALVLALASVAASVAHAGDEALTPEELDAKERELRSDLVQAETGARSRFATEVELGTQVDWVNDDQHGTLHAGFGFSFSPREVENLRVASFFAGIAAGQIGDEAHRWVHIETGYRPNFEIPIDSEFKPYLGGRHIIGMSSIGSDDGVDGTLANGAAVGLRLLGGLLSVEVHGDAMFSWNREFLVDGARTHWVPRFGFTVKSDLCAFAGGDICQYPAPTPEDIDLSALMDEALRDLRGALPTGSCARAEEALTLQVDKQQPSCGAADAEGFFCRFKGKSSADEARLIELARLVHGELSTCYDQGRVDERSAAKNGTMLKRKLRYGAYPPELRSAVCNAAAPLGEDAEANRCDKIDRARYACPRAGQALDVLAKAIGDRKR